MMTYYPVSSFVSDTRGFLQDLVSPYRYADDAIIGALQVALGEVSRLRPDIYLDLKYQSPLIKGDLGDGVPALPVVTSTTSQTTMVPVPVKYYQPVVWYMVGYLQFLDVSDTQDQRAAAFMQKFQTAMLTVAA